MTHAPHLAVSVFARGLLKRAVTRIYFADEAAANAADPTLLIVGDEAARATLIAAPSERGYRFDIRMQGRGADGVLRCLTRTRPGARHVDDHDADAGLFDGVLARGPVREAVSDRAWLQAMLDVEAALARAQAARRAGHRRRSAEAIAARLPGGGRTTSPRWGARRPRWATRPRRWCAR